MKKLQILVVALVAVFALSATTMAVAGKGKDQIKTTVEASYSKGSSTDPYDPFAKAKFKATVDSKKSKCVKDRKVTVKTKDGEKVGSEITDKDGKATIKAAGFGKGKYEVTVQKASFKKFVCKDASATVKVD